MASWLNEAEPVVYHDVKAWIAQQEANPKPLTTMQRRALGQLRRAIAADLRRSMEPEPDLGKTDWVSVMNLFTQARGGTVEYEEGGTPEGGFTARCILKWPAEPEPRIFPDPAAGAAAAPAFPRKKSAKKYAAKCCVEWLTACGEIEVVGEHVTFSQPERTRRPAVAPAKKRKLITIPTTTTTATTSSAARPSSTPAAAPNKPQEDPKPKVKVEEDAGDDPAEKKGEAEAEEEEEYDDPTTPTTARVAALCAHLGLRAPQYKLTRSLAAVPGAPAYDGYPDFGPDGFKVPAGLGRVTGVRGGVKLARRRIAEEVLAW
ncbi:73fa9c88-ab90-4e49-9cee-b56e528d4c36 [Thermothielavioides terrestris]|nr:73fa9c88-ab90-4e49-9cee-b56e528d4c36 [Thermothielavioides terrestris]